MGNKSIETVPNSPLEIIKERLQNGDDIISEKFVGLELTSLAVYIQKEKEQTLKNILEKGFEKISELQPEIDKQMDEVILPEVWGNSMPRMTKELFRSRAASMDKMEEAERKDFQAKSAQVFAKLEDFLKQKEPEFFDNVANWFSNSATEVANSFNKADWFNAENILPIGMITYYPLTYYKANDSSRGLGFMLKGMAIVGGIGSISKIAAPALKAAEKVLEGVGNVVKTGSGVFFNALMHLPRGGNFEELLTNPKVFLDGKWDQTRVQEYLVKNIDKLDDKTKDYIPDEIKNWYLKIVEGKELDFPKDEKEILASAEFCVQSMDDEVFFSEKDARKFEDQIRAGKWGKEGAEIEDLYRMLNTSYANRTIQYFLALPADSTTRLMFENTFKTSYMKRQDESEKKYYEKLNLKKMYWDKITKGGKIDIENVQLKGIAADMKHGGLKTIIALIIMLYAGVSGAMKVGNTIFGNNKDKEKMNVNSKDNLDPKYIAKIRTGLQKKNLKTVLAGLVSASVISSNTEKNVWKEINKLKDKKAMKKKEEQIITALTKGNFDDRLEGTISEVGKNFETALTVNAQLKVKGIKVFADSCSFKRKLKAGAPINATFKVIEGKGKNIVEKEFKITNIVETGTFSKGKFTGTYNSKEKLEFEINANGTSGEVSFQKIGMKPLPANSGMKKQKYLVKELVLG